MYFATKKTIWASSWDYGTAQSRQSLRCSHAWSMKVDKGSNQPEDQCFCIAHLSAEDMLKSAVIEEKKHLALFSLRTESDKPDATCELSP